MNLQRLLRMRRIRADADQRACDRRDWQDRHYPRQKAKSWPDPQGNPSEPPPPPPPPAPAPTPSELAASGATLSRVELDPEQAQARAMNRLVRVLTDRLEEPAPPAPVFKRRMFRHVPEPMPEMSVSDRVRYAGECAYQDCFRKPKRELSHADRSEIRERQKTRLVLSLAGHKRDHWY